MGKIIWLASYPKSGNTWVRAFLTSLLFPSYPFRVNNLIECSLSVDNLGTAGVRVAEEPVGADEQARHGNAAY